MRITFEVDFRNQDTGRTGTVLVTVEADTEVDAELAACQLAARHGMPTASRPVV